MKNINDYRINEELINESLIKSIKRFFKWLWSLTKSKPESGQELAPSQITGKYMRDLWNAGVTYDNELENKIKELEKQLKEKNNEDKIKSLEKEIQDKEEKKPTADYSNIVLTNKKIQDSMFCIDITKNINKVLKVTNTSKKLGFSRIYKFKEELKNNENKDKFNIKYFSVHLLETNLIFLCSVIKNYWDVQFPDNKQYKGYAYIIYESQVYFKTGTPHWLEYALNFIKDEKEFSDIYGYTILADKDDTATIKYLKSLGFDVDDSVKNDNILLYKKLKDNSKLNNKESNDKDDPTAVPEKLNIEDCKFNDITESTKSVIKKIDDDNLDKDIKLRLTKANATDFNNYAMYTGDPDDENSKLIGIFRTEKDYWTDKFKDNDNNETYKKLEKYINIIPGIIKTYNDDAYKCLVKFINNNKDIFTNYNGITIINPNSKLKQNLKDNKFIEIKDEDNSDNIIFYKVIKTDKKESLSLFKKYETSINEHLSIYDYYKYYKSINEELDENILWKLDKWFEMNEEQESEFIGILAAYKTNKNIKLLLNGTKLYDNIKEFVNFLNDDINNNNEIDYIYQFEKILSAVANNKSNTNKYFII